jgi:acetyl esterase
VRRAKLDPQMINVLEIQEKRSLSLDQIGNTSVAEVRNLYTRERAYWNADPPALASIEDFCIDGPVGDIKIRRYLPNNNQALPCLIYLHGGGFMMGNLDTHDRIMRVLAKESKLGVVGVDYHLAPEYRFPTALNETLAVIEYLESHGNTLGIDGTRLALGGDSAGANLAVGATQTVHATSPSRIRCLLLYYGAFGLRNSESRRRFGDSDDGVSEEDLKYYEKSYLRTADDIKDLRYNVLAGDASRLPSAFIGAAEYDPLLDDSLALKKHMDATGVASQLQIYSGVLHGFLHYGRILDKAGHALTEGANFLHRAFR